MASKTKIKMDDLNAVLKLNLFKGLDKKGFCMTGTMSVSRQQLESIISWCGGVNHSAVKSTTFALITPNDSDFLKGSKYTSALNQGIMIITEREFCEMILPSIEELRGNNDNGASH